MRANGDGVRVLTAPSADHYDGNPRWSPDSRKLAFERRSLRDEAEFGIVTIDVDRRLERRLVTGSAASPSWTADGLSVFAFVREGALWTIQADGSNARRLVDVRTPRDTLGFTALEPPRWSPDGRRIAIVDARGIRLLDRDGSHVRLVRVSGARGVAWSPDGGTLSFTAPVGNYSRGIFSSGFVARTELNVVPASGGRARRLTNDLANVIGNACWRP